MYAEPGILFAAHRRSVRRAVSAECQVVTDDPAFRLIGDRATDISPFGMFVEGESSVRVGDRLFVSLRAPGTSYWFDAPAFVARVVRGLRGGDEGRTGVGIRFGSLDGAARAVLEASLRKRPPPIPSRPLRRNYALTVQMIGARRNLGSLTLPTPSERLPALPR